MLTILPAIATILLLWLSSVNVPCWSQDEELRKHLLHALGGPFIVYRRNLQAELQLSSDQKQKLQDSLPDYLQKPSKIFDRFHNLESGPGEKELESIRPESYRKFWAILREILKPAQFKRLQQLELQHEGPSALFRPEIVKQLDITDDQRRRFMGIVQEMQRNMEPLMQEAHSGGNGEQIRLRAVRLYAEQEQKVESVLDDAQKRQWMEMYGKQFDVFNDS
jgi:hypothetical protein